MGSKGKAWIAAASIGAVEAMKDHGFCRWNYTLRSVHQHAKNNLRSTFQANNKIRSMVSSSSPSSSSDKAREYEESLRTVMFLNCWGPNN